MAEDLKSLIVDRGLIKAALTRFKTFARNSASITPVNQLKKRLETNIGLYDKFDRLQMQIEKLVAGTDTEEVHATEREEFETAYFEVVDEVETYIAQFTPNQNRISTASPTSTQAIDNIVRLPTLQLPSFDGNYSEWLKFKDTFTSVIHENNSLTDIQRFHYLNTSLKGVAARVIQELGVSEKNYKQAWELLKLRYEDSTTLKRHHVNSLFDLKSVQKQSEITLREFIDDATNHRLALRSLGEPVETWDTILVTLLSRKLDQMSIREWEKRIVSQKTMPTFNQFSAFIEERSRYLANIAVNTPAIAPRVDQRPRTNNSPRYQVASHVVNSTECPVCKANHAIYQCNEFRNSDHSQKTKIVQEARLCFNCLSSGHLVKACTWSHCRQCGRKHHSLLHNPEIIPLRESDAITAESEIVANVTNVIGHTVLPTAIVYIRDEKGQPQKCRVLLDSGSQANFITTEFCQRLGIKPTAIKSTVTGLGRAVKSIQGRASVTIHSRYGNFQHTVQCLSIEAITSNMPNFHVHRKKIEILNHVQLADPQFHVQGTIDMLVGAGIFWELLCVGQHRIHPNLLLQKTQLGWVLGGTFTCAGKETETDNRCHLVTFNNLNDIEEATVEETKVVDDWGHVVSEDNPADLLSRGTNPGALAEKTIWWVGPTWLQENSNLWPKLSEKPIDIPDERKVKPVILIATTTEDRIISRFSTYTRLLRSVAYCLRFVRITRNRINKLKVDTSGSLTGSLKTIEIHIARTRLERLTQGEAFSTEIKLLEAQQAPLKSSALRSLNIFLDNSGLLRVGGRLSNAPIDYDQKHLIILPSKHPFTDLIINHEHHRLMHAECQAVIASLQTRYWLVSAKNNVKRIIRKCIRCFRANPPSQVYQMGQLPASRVTLAQPFSTCGVDYAGSFLTKARTRSKVAVKSYLCIFVCFVTKAVHLELVTDRSTDAFINCFQRFIARRGRCRCIFSDHGTDFIGTRNKLAELNVLIKCKTHDEKIANALNQEAIKWRLIPPHAPHLGGLWEGAVKSAKHHLTRVIGEQRLTFEELYTLLTQIESCLNSRPLSPLSTDPTDLNPLTPGHFLIGTALTTLPSHDLRDLKVTRLNRYQLIQQMVQHFWQRWQREYTHHLQQRHKWQSPTISKIAVNSLVIIKEDNLAPLQWSMGRIIQVHPGSDGMIRVATIKTSTGTIKRPVTKLCILPLEELEVSHEM